MHHTIVTALLRFSCTCLLVFSIQHAVLAQQADTLSAEDMIAIQQLVNKFNFALDYCTAGGEDFADLFTIDGQYIIDMGDGMPSVRRTREELINLAGGPDCEARITPPSSYILHYSASLIIEPALEGARGLSYAIYPASKGQYFSDDIAGQVGIYHDVYSKVAKGWRFKSRRHELNPVAGDLEL
ncbi:MAG: hypothetical protein ACI934_000739 [Pseudohongiellaceae bacterium]|jgi:hypothetical protein